MRVATIRTSSQIVLPYRSWTHVSRARQGVFAACLAPSSPQDKAWETFKLWKAQPSAHPDVTAHMANEVVELVRAVLPVIGRDWIVTAPPQGKSAAIGSEYAAGMLGKAVATKLDLDYVTIFKPQVNKKYHGKFESLKRRQEPFELQIVPNTPTIVIDDLITSGTTMRRALDALARAGVVAFGFAYMAT